MARELGSDIETGAQFRQSAVLPARELPADLLAPVIAGARARGIADAFEMMGHGVVLLDASGRVLHASDRARQMMQGVVSVVSDHLVGSTACANAAIEGLVAAGLSGRDAAGDLLESESGARIKVRTVAVPTAPEERFQLLKAVVVVSEA